MKRFWFTLGLVAIVAVGSYAVTRALVRAPVEDHRSWLQREFQLTDRQLAAVEKLQADYEPVCAEHCALVMEARVKLETSPDDAALRAEVARLKQICAEATTRHLQQVAAQMDAAQGQRFLALMAPKVTGHDHAQPLGLP